MLQNLPIEILNQIIDFVVPIFSLNKILKVIQPDASSDEMDKQIVNQLEIRFYIWLTNYLKATDYYGPIEQIYFESKKRFMRDVISLYRTCAGFYRILSQKRMKRFWRILSVFSYRTEIETNFMSKLGTKFEELDRHRKEKYEGIPFEQYNWYIVLFEENERSKQS